MKKLTAIILIGCLVFCAAGYHFVFRFQVWQAKSEMKLRLLHAANDEITELSFDTGEQQQLQWEDDHELRYNGEMYDVIEQFYRDGELVLRCVDDRKETSLIEKYLDLNKNNTDNTPLSSLVQIMSAQFILPPKFDPQPPFAWVRNQFGFYASNTVSITSSIYTPPPEFC